MLFGLDICHFVVENSRKMQSWGSLLRIAAGMLCGHYCKPQMSQTEQLNHRTVSSAGLKVTAHLLVPAGFPHLWRSAPRQEHVSQEAQAGRQPDGYLNGEDLFSSRSVVQNRGIFAVLPAQVPDLFDFFARTVFYLILPYIF